VTIKPHVARALRDARARLRDVAAADHAAAAERREAAAAELASEHDRLTAFVDDAPARLARASSVNDLDRVAMLVGAHHGEIASAATRHAETVALVELMTGALRERTRQLKTAERIVDNVHSARDAREARGEQRGTDDLAARRR